MEKQAETTLNPKGLWGTIEGGISFASGFRLSEVRAER